MAIADGLAVSRATRNIVLLGDPQQLEHPNQAAHPKEPMPRPDVRVAAAELPPL